MTQTLKEKTTHGFQAEVKQLLHLVVHSLYSNKEIFLRELVSNASDAADKLRLAAISQQDLYEDDSELKIRILIDEEANTLTVRDNGIGMTSEEVVANLGTIARSGTKEFINKLSGSNSKDANLIGQFGVGFYAGFIVADKITVETRAAGVDKGQGVRWVSSGEGDFTIEPLVRSQRGTDIILHLKDDAKEFLDDWKLRTIIKRYSDHISWPIEMLEQAPMTAEKEGEDAEKAQEEKPREFEVINSATALWTLPKTEVKKEQYEEFYKHISHDFDTPLTWSHNHVEGKQSYISLLYIPKKAPFDLYHPEFKHGLKLFVKRVFIMDQADQFLPRFLRFVRGVVDSSDMPLNVSRELLQDNKLVESIRAANTKRVLSLLEKLAKNDPEQYQEFWKEFGLVLKEGPIEDFTNREQIAKLLRFSTTFDDNSEAKISLADYVARMKEGQDKIYYINADSFTTAKNSPHLEVFRKKGIEVLLLSDRIDEWLMGHLGNFDGKTLVSITKGELDLGEPENEEEKQQQEKVDKEFTSVIEQMKKVLGEKVKDVRLTHRLTVSPACVVADENELGREMQRMLQAAGQDVPESKPIFELNPEHPILQRLQAETDDERFASWTHILLDQAILAEGGQLDDSAQFVQRLNNMLLELSR